MRYVFCSLFIVVFCGCELLDMSSKRASYTIDTVERYPYVTIIAPNLTDSHIETINRSTFDIPSTAEIKRFLVKNIYIDINPNENNDCPLLKVSYLITTGIPIYRSEVSLGIQDGPVESFFLNNNFTVTLTELRNAIQNTIIQNESINLHLRTECTALEKVDASITVTLEIVAEYTTCEELPSTLDLPDC